MSASMLGLVLFFFLHLLLGSELYVISACDLTPQVEVSRTCSSLGHAYSRTQHTALNTPSGPRALPFDQSEAIALVSGLSD